MTDVSMMKQLLGSSEEGEPEIISIPKKRRSMSLGGFEEDSDDKLSSRMKNVENVIHHLAENDNRMAGEAKEVLDKVEGVFFGSI